MGDWSIVRLENLASIEPGSIAIGPFGSRMKSGVYTASGVPVIRGTNISSTRTWKGDWVYVSDDFADGLPNCNVHEGDLVFPHRGSIGEVGIVPGDTPRYMLSTSLMKFRPDHDKVSALFLFYYFRSAGGRAEIMRYSSQVGTPGIGQPLTSLRQFRVPVPSRDFQDRIAGTLSALDDKIELNRRMNETLEAIARAIFKDWFVDFGPTRAKAEGRAPYLAPELWELFPDVLDDEGEPAGWEEKSFLSFVDIVGGGTPKTRVAEYWGGKIPWFSVVDTPPNGGVYVHSTEKTISEKGLAESSAKLIHEGTTIITARGTVGNIAMAARDMTFNQSCYALRAQVPVGDRFVYLAAERMVHRLQAMAHGSVFPTITRDTFRNLTFPWVGAQLFERFEEILEPIFSKIKANGMEIEILAQTRDLLLPKLMSGEIRLPDAERAVTAVA